MFAMEIKNRFKQMIYLPAQLFHSIFCEIHNVKVCFVIVTDMTRVTYAWYKRIYIILKGYLPYQPLTFDEGNMRW